MSEHATFMEQIGEARALSAILRQVHLLKNREDKERAYRLWVDALIHVGYFKPLNATHPTS